MKYLLLLFSFSFYGQVLHHQMLSSQGVTKKLSNGLTISQTIGQQSVIGNSNNDFVVMQGFQQNLWGHYIASNVKTEIIVRTYPNPFTDFVHFQFSKNINSDISVYFFNISGHLVHQYKSTLNGTIVTIDLSKVPSSEYLVQIRTAEITYYTKIIKI
ncbi:T9SS type A sorting domain-containing protein [Flavobacterium sp. NG2]|uniref:T9SS type A sorting domain-containing protein n=1 Tax=Flavobacterium sp. NG2 TaxID=3097547 RepID=UPI002A7F9EC6|nr:T9SS type A sorting domain-containing protein [Flavobacterium sp. NG2]WPR70475.1 T9SS type A sorting domain-containing protein [Flavobacterium sp. NG2]